MNFKNSEYIANTGIVFGPYGYVGFYSTKPLTRRKITVKSFLRLIKLSKSRCVFRKLLPRVLSILVLTSLDLLDWQTS